VKKKPNPAPVKNQKLTLIAMSVLIVLLAGVLIGVLVFMKNQPIETRGVPTIVAVAPLEPDSSQWGINYPNQYTTLLQTEFNNTRTTYGGSEPFSKLEEDPRLLQLFAGYSFSKEYNEERGHWNALTDVRATDRLSDKTPGTCYSCKSSNNPQLWAEMGMQAYDEMPFAQLGEQITEPIGCANCHEAGTMRLVVTNPALETALVAQGLEWQTFTRQEMRTIVCANCHVEYYFDGPSNLLTFPWTNGTTIEDIEAYYAEDGHVDWTHPVPVRGRGCNCRSEDGSGCHTGTSPNRCRAVQDPLPGDRLDRQMQPASWSGEPFHRKVQRQEGLPGLVLQRLPELLFLPELQRPLEPALAQIRQVSQYRQQACSQQQPPAQTGQVWVLRHRSDQQLSHAWLL